MASNSFKIIFLCTLVCSFNFATTKAQDADVSFFYRNCEANKTTANSIYETNVRTLFSSLSSTAAAHTFNNTAVGRNSSDTVYGLFMCRGDVSSPLCRQCVVNATDRLSSDPECSLSIEGVTWYDECMVRYSNVSFFSTVDTFPALWMWNTANISSNSTRFMGLVYDTLNQTAKEAANSGDRYSTKEANVSEFQTLYCLTQCTQDLSPQNCTTCLTQAIEGLLRFSDGKQGGRVLYPSCNVRYELYPFYRAVDEAPEGLVPETKYPKKIQNIQKILAIFPATAQTSPLTVLSNQTSGPCSLTCLPMPPVAMNSRRKREQHMASSRAVVTFLVPFADNASKKQPTK
ncbi:Cysteine-rich receptor protein kinase 25 [Spatholobus suberectus]|nr:Cysteine-rich receptor protein kinase 25 [Spatholobus suberectus]